MKKILSNQNQTATRALQKPATPDKLGEAPCLDNQVQQPLVTKEAFLDQRSVEQFRASRIAFKTELVSSGYWAAADFATSNPNFGHLTRLKRWRKKNAGKTPGSFLELAGIMTNQDGCSAEKIEKEIEELYGSDVNEPDWIHSFMVTAIQMFAHLNYQCEFGDNRS